VAVTGAPAPSAATARNARTDRKFKAARHRSVTTALRASHASPTLLPPLLHR
jgi:hypothetical protein